MKKTEAMKIATRISLTAIVEEVEAYFQVGANWTKPPLKIFTAMLKVIIENADSEVVKLICERREISSADPWKALMGLEVKLKPFEKVGLLAELVALSSDADLDSPNYFLPSLKTISSSVYVRPELYLEKLLAEEPLEDKGKKNYHLKTFLEVKKGREVERDQ